MNAEVIRDADIPNADPEAVIRQYEPLICKISLRYAPVLSRSGAVGLDDLEQVGRIAVMEAQKAYDPEIGISFMTYIFDRIRSAMRVTAGFNSVGALKQDIANTDYLDAPLLGTEDLSLLDTIPDDHPTGEEALIEAETKSEICDAVHAAVDRMKNPKQREIIRRVWFNEEDKAVIAADVGMSLPVLRNAELQARYRLRRDERLRKLAYPLFNVGAGRFNNTWTSAVELAILWREERFDETFGEGAYAGNHTDRF